MTKEVLIALAEKLKGASADDAPSFSLLVDEAMTLLDLPARDMASEFSCSLPTIERWRTGASAPHPLGRPPVFSYLLKRCNSAIDKFEPTLAVPTSHGQQIASAVLAFADTLADRAALQIKNAEADARARRVKASDDPAVIEAKKLLDSIEHGRTWVRAALEPPADSYEHTPFTPAERESVLLCSATSALNYLTTTGRLLWRIEGGRR